MIASIPRRTMITEFSAIAGRPNCFLIRNEYSNSRPDEFVAMSHGEMMSSVLEIHGIVASIEDCTEFVSGHRYPDGQG